ncbi:flagellar export protein FliJ [Eubacteriales bacterium OttesenSCG-928-N14]|nr:flagellar export protein FliJ [Eubacteriales bacterium OttesenSCG-928-N14]
MRAFKFTLQSLYDVKQTIEKEQMSQLREAEERVANLQLQLKQMYDSIRAAQADYSDAVQHGSTAQRLIGYGYYFERMEETVKLQKIKIKNAEVERDRIREQLIETKKEIRALEKLYEKQYAAYQEEAKQEEEKLVNDILSYQVASSDQ